MQRRRHPNSAIFPDELMLEIISWLPVKHIIQLRCVNKFFKTLIFDPHFVRMHLNKSRRNSNLALPWYRNLDKYDEDYRLITLSIPYVLGIQTQNQYAISDPYYRLNDDLNDDSIIIRKIVGSCNGLLCVLSISSSDEHCLCFWNPATRTKSNEFMVFDCDLNCNMFSFGYDNSSQTYKVVAFCVEESGCNKVKVFSLGDNSWRDLQCFPLIPCH
ncbi:F-box/kelch-repeat protein, partial [Trifolium pratense]